MGHLWVTVGWSSVGYHSMWHLGFQRDKVSHRQYQSPALHSWLACSWELKMNEYSIAWKGGSATGVSISPTDLLTPSLSPGLGMQSPDSQHRQGGNGAAFLSLLPSQRCQNWT